jgi:micrococcal nuclease
VRRSFTRFLTAVLAFSILAAGCLAQGQDPPRPPTPAAPSPAPTAKVLRVIDGDTLVLSIDGRPVNVRLIGVDTPETVHPSKPVERFGREATRFLKDLVEGKSVRVEYEPGAARLDRYSRTLAYLYIEPGGLFVNREIVARGYGHAYTAYGCDLGSM